jgi:urea transport system permease protein
MHLKNLFAIILCSMLLLLTADLQALTIDQAKAIVTGETDSRIEALNKAATDADEQLINLIQALADDAVKFNADHVFLVRGDQVLDAITGAPTSLAGDAEDVISNNRMRSELDSAMASLQLFSSDAVQRLKAVMALIKEPDASKMPSIQKAMLAEKQADIQKQLSFAKAAIELASEDANLRQQAAQILAASVTPDTVRLLNDQLTKEDVPAVQSQIQASLEKLKNRLAWGERLGALFTGLSLGSILLLVALGLAITYGLMGVINMAHGELMMVGAYATYVVQNLFRSYLPQHFEFYLLLAVPASFLVAALVGAALERLVLRHLYGRPLETLLATWGISLMLMQAVRSVFGAQNVAVENPNWMSGGIQLLSNLTLPWNRVVSVLFSLAVLASMALLIGKTRLGLFVRGVTQNRPMASCMGVNTARIDTYAFALGSGIAGLAGCALSQIGNVGPDLGQNYIVDSFMVVVLGGVGQLAGTVYAALGLGVLNKLLEGWAGAVLAKIAVLVFIVIFIQKRPQGLFAMKGRSAEA